MINKKSIEEQYKDESYSRFVESPVNSVIYNDYYHHSFFERLNKLINQILLESKKHQQQKQKHPSTTAKPKIRILDIGCGNCILSRKIVRQFNSANNNGDDYEIEIVGLDASLPMLNEAKRLCDDENISQIRFIHGNATIFATDFDKFDLIISGFFFVHAETKQQLLDVFQQISNNLKPGGTTIHIIPSSKEMEEDDGEEDGRVFRAMLPLYNNSKEDVNNDDNLELEKEIELFDHFWKPKTYKSTSEQVGLMDFSWSEGNIAPNSKLTSKDVLPIRVCIMECSKEKKRKEKKRKEMNPPQLQN